MGFWVFMLVHILLLPAIMIGFGQLFRKHPPRQINSIYGYRTKMSRINMDTWNYAHKYFGKLWVRTGWIILPGSAVGMFFAYGKDEGTIGIIGAIIVTIQILFLLLPILWTEKELHRRFTLDGKLQK